MTALHCHVCVLPLHLSLLMPTDRGGLRVLRIGEPAKVRSCLQACTLKVQLAQAMDKDPEITAARREQQDLRRKLRRKSRSQLER